LEDEIAWWELTPGQRFEYLQENFRRLQEHDHLRPVSDPPGSTYAMDGAHVSDLTSFLCALGEAINGPRGYFGSTIEAMDDCAVGGFGATPPFTLEMHQARRCREHLDARAMVDWCEDRIAQRSYLDEDGLAWLSYSRENADNEGASLFELILDVLASRGVRVVLVDD